MRDIEKQEETEGKKDHGWRSPSIGAWGWVCARGVEGVGGADVGYSMSWTRCL